MERAVALLLSAMLTATACGGAKFSSDDAAAGRHAGGSQSAGAGVGSQSGASATSPGGQASEGGGGSGAGETSSSSAGESPIAGTAGAGGASQCAELGGHEFSAHCYVDVTTTSVPYTEAVAACVELASRVGRPGRLLVLDSPKEQMWVLSQFLGAFTDASDAWLGLTCDAVQHPELTSCYCTNCDASQRAEKRAAWSWLDNSTAAFGWVGQNPDGEGRCSALAYNSSNATWGWVDRNCVKTTHQLSGFPIHDYRTICELE